MNSKESITTTVLPGHRMEVALPAFTVGQTAVIVTPGPPRPKTDRFDLIGFLDSLPSGPRAFSSWEQYEKHFQAERESWDR